MEPVIRLEHVNQTFSLDHKRQVVLKDIELAIQPGEFFVFLGPSGSGKSTILRIIASLIKPTAGSVVLGGDVTKKDISFVFQHFAIFPWLTVSENIEFGLKMRGEPLARRRRIVHDLIRDVGLQGNEHKHPGELSGGMRQRVGIARALAVEPKIMLLDEPFSELDSFTAKKLRADLLRIWAERKMTVLMVTHLITEAVELADRIAVLTSTPARIEEILPVSMPRPRNPRSPDFFELEDRLEKIVQF